MPNVPISEIVVTPYFVPVDDGPLEIPDAVKEAFAARMRREIDGEIMVSILAERFAREDEE